MDSSFYIVLDIYIYIYSIPTVRLNNKIYNKEIFYQIMMYIFDVLCSIPVRKMMYDAMS